MGIIDTFNLVAGIASIGGAAFSLWQANKSGKAAREADSIRKQMIRQRENVEIGRLQASCSKAIKSMEKYGPASTSSQLSGISPDRDAFDVQEFILLLKDHRALFGTDSSNAADIFYEIVEPTLNLFSSSKEPNALRDNGREIIRQLLVMSSLIKMKLNE